MKCSLGNGRVIRSAGKFSVVDDLGKKWVMKYRNIYTVDTVKKRGSRLASGCIQGSMCDSEGRRERGRRYKTRRYKKAISMLMEDKGEKKIVEEEEREHAEYV